jgi:hypothetical protein
MRITLSRCRRILTEQSLRYTILKVLVGSRNDPDVGTHGYLATDPVELALRKDSQQSGLELRRHVADFVEEQRPAVRLLEASPAKRVCTGERAFLVAEQFGFSRSAVKAEDSAQ